MLPSHDRNGRLLPHTARDWLNVQASRPGGLFDSIEDDMRELARLVTGASMWMRAIEESRWRSADEARDLLLEHHGLLS